MIAPNIAWFILGIILLMVEAFVPIPTFLLAGVMGIAAFLVAAILSVVTVPLAIQILIWLIISTGMGWYARRFVPRGSNRIKESDEAITIAPILAGQTGRVRYEGNSWKARCDDPQTEIEINQKVYVLRKQGTTLIVMPAHWLLENFLEN